MRSEHSPQTAPVLPPITFQADRVRRRINVSPALAAVIAGHAFGARVRDDVVAVHLASAARVAAASAGLPS